MPTRGTDPQWENFYIDEALQHGRHAFLAETEPAGKGKLLFAAEVCLIPRWKYLKRLAGHCEAEL